MGRTGGKLIEMWGRTAGALAGNADPQENLAVERIRRPRRARWIGGGIALILVGTGAILWLQRVPIADSFIARELAARGVQGSYVVTRIGPRTQRLDRLVIGNPARPDLTARFLEVDVGWSLTGPTITRVQADGVRVRGQLLGNALNFGQLERLIPRSGDGEARLPDWLVEISDSRIDLASDYGPLVMSLQGQGQLRSGFEGALGISATELQAGDCRLERLVAPLDIGTEAGRISIKGPATSRGLSCASGSLAVGAPKLDLDVKLDPGLSDIGGALSLHADGVAQASRALAQVTGLVTFKGDREALRGSASFAATEASLPGFSSDAIRVGGGFAARPGGSDRGIAWNGTATIDNLRPDGTDRIAELVRSLEGTPLAPLGRKLALAVAEAGKRNRVELSGAVNAMGRLGNASINRLVFTSASGAHLKSGPDALLKVAWPQAKLEAKGEIDVGGGGLPEGTITFASGANGALGGNARFNPYSSGNTRLSLSPVRFSFDRIGRGRISAVASLDGPLPDGWVRGLVVPLDSRIDAAGVALAAGCMPVRWTQLQLATLTLDPAMLELCGLADGKLGLSGIRLTGRLGNSPISANFASASYLLGNRAFDLVGPDVRIGAGSDPVIFKAARLTGAATAAGFAGKIVDGAGRIGALPFDMRQIAADWRFSGGRLSVDGQLRVADLAEDKRFNPLLADGVKLTLARGQIAVTGTLLHPTRHVPIASLAIAHDLGKGSGTADFELTKLRFGNELQPDDLTPLSLGVVANVFGPVEGRGQVRWSPEKVSSDGAFSMDDMSFAAAFGPVTGFSTTIAFDDLLNLHTRPGQQMTIGSVNPGIEVNDGKIQYSIQSRERAIIEGGRWPFSGGTLELLPTVLELDAQRPRNLTFRVIGLDAGSFINTLQLENISATGTYDGLLPMIFDTQGGRIEGGVLVARQSGNPPLVLNSRSDLKISCDPTRQSGELAYVGEVSNADIGAFGRLAFDALKHLRYRCLSILLDGALDGEFVTQVKINGINQGTEESRKSFLARPFLGLPFIFNVRIEAPFRGLIGTAAGLTDPNVVIRKYMDDLKTPTGSGAAPLAVQPPDSEKKIEGDRK